MASNPERDLPERDLKEVFSATSALWEKLGSRDILITGASGFFGGWLLHSFLRARRELGFRGKIIALTRDLASVSKRSPALTANSGIQWIQGDVRHFTTTREFSHVIHAATAAGPEEFEILSEGTRNVLEQASRGGAERVLLISSGAVYGGNSEKSPICEEEFRAGLEHPRGCSSYMDGKRSSENHARSLGEKLALKIVVARGFAFTGPGLPLDASYAVSSFVRDVLDGKPISIRGDGSPVRSYMYASDLAIWLWRLLAEGSGGEAYNVGSEEAVSIFDLARTLAEVSGSFGLPRPEVVIAGSRAGSPAGSPAGNQETGRGGAWYVPDTSKARLLGLSCTKTLRSALKNTLEWHLC